MGYQKLEEVFMRPSSLRKRQKYLQVAAELFLEQGYEGTSLDQLIEHCGGSKLTLYNYFNDKQGLLKAVVVELTERLQLGLSIDVDADRVFREELLSFALKYLEFIYHPELLKLARLLMTQTKTAPELVAFFLERSSGHSQQALQDYLMHRQAMDKLVITDLAIASEQFLGALKGNRHFEALFGGQMLTSDEMKIYAKHAVDNFIRCYQS